MNKVLLAVGLLSAGMALGQNQTTKSSSTTTSTSNYNTSNTDNYNSQNATMGTNSSTNKPTSATVSPYKTSGSTTGARSGSGTSGSYGNSSNTGSMNTGSNNMGTGTSTTGTYSNSSATGGYNSTGSMTPSTSSGSMGTGSMTTTPSNSGNTNSMGTTGTSTTTPSTSGSYNSNSTGTGTTTNGSYNTNGTNNTNGMGTSGTTNTNSMGTSTTTPATTDSYNSNTGATTTTTSTNSTRTTAAPYKTKDYKNFAYGIYAGLNSTRFQGESIDKDNPSGRIGYQAGFFVRGGGRLYGQIGAEYFASSSNYFRPGDGQKLAAIRDQIDIQYVQIPVYIGFKLIESDRGISAIRLQAGVEYANRISSKSGQFNLSSSEIKSGSFNALGQLGFDIGPFLIDLTYHHGLSNAVEITNFQGSSRRILSASVGFKF